MHSLYYVAKYEHIKGRYIYLKNKQVVAYKTTTGFQK